MLDLKADEVEEWIITAINNDIIDARIDQIQEEIIIKTHRLRQLNENEWKQVLGKVSGWKDKFSQIHGLIDASKQ